MTTGRIARTWRRGIDSRPTPCSTTICGDADTTHTSTCSRRAQSSTGASSAWWQAAPPRASISASPIAIISSGRSPANPHAIIAYASRSGSVPAWCASNSALACACASSCRLTPCALASARSAGSAALRS